MSVKPSKAAPKRPRAKKPASRWRSDLARIRHQLRTPINHIIGFSEMLQEESAPELPRSFGVDLSKIRSGGKQLLELINHYFDDERARPEPREMHRLMHELRTPVNHIIGYSEMLMDEAMELGRRDLVPDLERIHGAAAQWLSLMEKHLVEPILGRASRQPPVSLPRRAHATLSAELGLPASLPLSEPAEAGQATVLVVDDDPANRDLLERRLRRQGFRTAAVGTGRKAIALLAERPFDLVLLDMIMPGWDGCEVLRRIKADARWKELPVIMVSALDQVDRIARCIEMGAEDYLAKPFNPVFLRARIGAVLEKKRLRDRERLFLDRLTVEQQKSERLLLSILPASVALRLKQGEAAIADSFPEATVLFADLVGFTSLSMTISATEMVRLLDEVFSAFDLLVEHHGCEKVKTIGDAYMAAGGLPIKRPDHAAAVAALALDMQKELDNFNSGYRTSLRMRVGINTGPVIAGIIGRNKFIYDLWGDTVNTASRMESHGIPGRIQVTESTFQLLEGQFELQRRGLIEVKGKGQMVGYWLMGKK